MYVAAANTLHAVSPVGAHRWKMAFDGDGVLQWSPVVAADGLLYVTLHDADMTQSHPRVLSALNGSTLKAYAPLGGLLRL